MGSVTFSSKKTLELSSGEAYTILFLFRMNI